MRPIFWGIILFLIGTVGWVFSVVLAVITFGAFKILTYVFGILFVASIPIALVFELARFIKNKR